METPPSSDSSVAIISESDGTQDIKRKWSLWKWLKERRTWMSMAMFFMLICGGLLTSAMGPALPIIEEKQCNM